MMTHRKNRRWLIARLFFLCYNESIMDVNVQEPKRAGKNNFELCPLKRAGRCKYESVSDFGRRHGV